MRIISEFKKFIPMSVLFFLKYGKCFLKPRKIITESKEKRIFYLDAPDYSNLGDQAIALAIKEFSQRLFPEYEFVEVLQKDVASYSKSLKNEIHRDDIIFLTGGGNMGDIYRIYEATRRYIIKRFPKNKIIVFPQTIDYSKTFWGRMSCNYSKRVYRKHKRLTLLAREKKSFKLMKQLYGEERVFLCPDIVLSMNPTCIKSEQEKVGLCLRDDCESVLSEQDKECLSTYLRKEKMSFKSISTIATVEHISGENRKGLVEEKLREFASMRFVITDRLHAMLFCAITNTPCVALANSNGKVRGVYDWIKKYENITFLENHQDFQVWIKEKKFTFLSKERIDDASFNCIEIAVREGL